MNYKTKQRVFIGKSAGTNLKHRVFYEKDGKIFRKDVPPAFFDKLDIPDETTEVTYSYIVESEYKKLAPSKKTEYAKWQRANKGYTKKEAFDVIKRIKKSASIGNFIGSVSR